ncbi:sodium-dependent multivitamin transporter-like, partial [Saccoglossus kowalevskii]
LMPYFVMDILSFLPGLPGLFVACMFSGALSTVSSGLNSLAAVTGEDIIKQIWPKMDDNKYTKITKILALSYGLLCIFMAYISSLMGSVLQAALSIFGMIGGPLLGLFSLGMFFPWANSKGAVVGLFSGLIMSFWVGIGGFIYKPFVEKPPLETYNCPNETVSNITTTTMQYVSGQTTAAFNTITTQEAPVTIIQDTYPAIADYYSISYLYYGGVAWIAVIVVGLIVSFITGPTKPEEVDPKTISPLADKCCCCLSASTRETLYCGVQFKVEEEEKKYSLDNKPNIAVSNNVFIQINI